MPEGQYVYCLSCNNGSEASLKNELVKRLPAAKVLYVTIDREEWTEGKWVIKTRPLLCGYVFVYTTFPVVPYVFNCCKKVNRLLSYREDTYATYALRGSDLEFADWVLKNDGHIGISRATTVGEKTNIVTGPLAFYEGEILKIDRHRHSALVAVSVGKQIRKVWLGLQWINESNASMIKSEMTGRNS